MTKHEGGRDKAMPAGERSARRSRRPTIRDVAQLAAVSRMTVSRVISDPKLVLPATRARVQQAIADLGYVPDKAAGSLSSKRTGFIALMLPTLTNANFAAVAHGLTEALREADYDLLIAYTEYNMNEEIRQLRNLLARRPEALVIAGATQNRETSKLLLATDIPIVEIADLPSRPIEHVIGFSNYQVGRMAGSYLARKGFTRIGAVGGSSSGEVVDHRGEERIRGFEDELRSHGLSTDAVVRHGSAPLSYDHGAQALAVLIERAPDVQAVFAVSDLSAVGVAMECQRRGIAVPDQISIMGFGDFEIGQVINPPLTTIHVDFPALGHKTGELLLELLSSSETAAPYRIDVGLEVIERKSVAGA